MSRIRETARLRLVPPIDVDDSGPIKDFLAQIENLRSDPLVGPYFVTAAPAPAPVQAAPAPSPLVPFQLGVEVFTAAQTLLGSAGPISPSLSSSTEQTLPETTGVTAQITASFANPAAYSFNSCVLTGPQGTLPSNVQGTSFSWQIPLPLAPSPFPMTLTWLVQDPGGSTYSGATPIVLKTIVEAGNFSRAFDLLDVLVGATPNVTVTSPPAPGSPRDPSPCAAECCDPAGAPRFKVPPPWLHENPEVPGQASDPRVLALALVYAWTASEQARAGAAPVTRAAQTSAQLALAKALYNAVFKASFSTVPVTQRYDLTAALQKLLQTWCKSLLYPGPKCGCGPHGVVVGCARIEGGQIAMVDPWGGRRWVVHYPLLAYWGQQFGITAPDVIASKIFDVVCCVAHLQKPGDSPGAPPPPAGQPALASRAGAGGVSGSGNSTSVGTPVPATGRSASVALGSSMLVFEAPETLQAKLASLGFQAVRSETLSPGDFAIRVWGAVNASAPASGAASPGSGSWVNSTPVGFPDVHLLAPDSATAAASGTTAAVATGSLASLLGAQASPTRQPAVPSLLRGVTADVSRRILASLPISPTDHAQGVVTTALSGAGVKTVADLLSSDPEALLAGPLKGANADAFSGVLTSAETTAQAVATAVADTMAKAPATGLIVRSDLNDPTRSAALSAALLDKLAALNVPSDTIARAVQAAATGA